MNCFRIYRRKIGNLETYLIRTCIVGRRPLKTKSLMRCKGLDQRLLRHHIESRWGRKSQGLQVQGKDQEVMIQLALLWWQNSRVWLIRAQLSTKGWPKLALETDPKTIGAQCPQPKSDKQTWQVLLWETTNSMSSQEEQSTASSRAQRSKSSPSQSLPVYHRIRFLQINKLTKDQI